MDAKRRSAFMFGIMAVGIPVDVGGQGQPYLEECVEIQGRKGKLAISGLREWIRRCKDINSRMADLKRHQQVSRRLVDGVEAVKGGQDETPLHHTVDEGQLHAVVLEEELRREKKERRRNAKKERDSDIDTLGE